MIPEKEKQMENLINELKEANEKLMIDLEASLKRNNMGNIDHYVKIEELENELGHLKQTIEKFNKEKINAEGTIKELERVNSRQKQNLEENEYSLQILKKKFEENEKEKERLILLLKESKSSISETEIKLERLTMEYNHL